MCIITESVTALGVVGLDQWVFPSKDDQGGTGFAARNKMSLAWLITGGKDRSDTKSSTISTVK